jgi:hypothetical protein
MEASDLRRLRELEEENRKWDLYMGNVKDFAYP